MADRLAIPRPETSQTQTITIEETDAAQNQVSFNLVLLSSPPINQLCFVFCPLNFRRIHFTFFVIVYSKNELLLYVYSCSL